MKAIVIKYLPETNTKCVRLKATTEAGSITESRDYALDADVQARNLAQKYCDKFNWGITYGFGTLPNGDYVATLFPF